MPASTAKTTPPAIKGNFIRNLRRRRFFGHESDLNLCLNILRSCCNFNYLTHSEAVEQASLTTRRRRISCVPGFAWTSRHGLTVAGARPVVAIQVDGGGPIRKRTRKDVDLTDRFALFIKRRLCR